MSFNYFAYGSNLSHRQMSMRCPDARPVGSAKLLHYRLVFAGNSDRWGGAVADVRPDPEWYVQGAIYNVKEDDLKLLDLYEGCPDFYRREEIEIIIPTGEVIPAIVYRMTLHLKTGKPSRAYLETIIKGFFDFGITPPPEISAAEYVD